MSSGNPVCRCILFGWSDGGRFDMECDECERDGTGSELFVND